MKLAILIALSVAVGSTQGCKTSNDKGKVSQTLSRATDGLLEGSRDIIRGDNGKDKEDFPHFDLPLTLTKGDKDVRSWKVTLDLKSLTYRNGELRWEYADGDLSWPDCSPKINTPTGPAKASVSWFVLVDGKLYSASPEWVGLNQPFQTEHAFSKGFRDELEGFDASGYEFWVCISGGNRVGSANVQERSRLFKVIYD